MDHNLFEHILNLNNQILIDFDLLKKNLSFDDNKLNYFKYDLFTPEMVSTISLDFDNFIKGSSFSSREFIGDSILESFYEELLLINISSEISNQISMIIFRSFLSSLYSNNFKSLILPSLKILDKILSENNYSLVLPVLILILYFHENLSNDSEIIQLFKEIVPNPFFNQFFDTFQSYQTIVINIFFKPSEQFFSNEYIQLLILFLPILSHFNENNFLLFLNSIIENTKCFNPEYFQFFINFFKIFYNSSHSLLFNSEKILNFLQYFLESN